MRRQIKYRAYHFYNPPILSKDDYHQLKAILITKPKYSLNPPSFFFEEFRFELIALGVGGLSLLSLWGLDSIIELKFIKDSLGFLMLITFLFTLGTLISFFLTWDSYSDFQAQKESYYSTLKKDINSSKNYPDFLLMRISVDTNLFNNHFF